VTLAELSAVDTVATTGGDVAQLLDVDVDQGAGMIAFIAADWLAGGPVQVSKVADAAADQDGMDGGGGQADSGAIWAGPSRWVQRRCTIRRTTEVGVRRGERWGRLDRSAIPAGPWSR
jgi:hypothetical protein